MSIGERIRSVRKARGLSQESLARGADISLNVVGKIENGVVRDPHISTLRGIAATLEVDLAELLEEPALPLDDALQEEGHLELPIDYDTIVSEVLRVVKPETSEALDAAVLEQGVRELSARCSVEDLHRFERELPKERSRVYQRGARSPRTATGLPREDVLGDLLNIDLNIECVRHALEAKERQTTRVAAE